MSFPINIDRDLIVAIIKSSLKHYAKYCKDLLEENKNNGQFLHQQWFKTMTNTNYVLNMINERKLYIREANIKSKKKYTQ